MVLDAIYKTDGCAIAVDDDNIWGAKQMLASREGLYVCPEGAATLSAAKQLLKTGWIKPVEKVVLLNTGSGLQYPETVTIDPPLLQPSDKAPRLSRHGTVG